MDTPVLIVGGGPVGLALAVELGWRGVECTLIEQSDGTIATPKMQEVNTRTMEFCRRWGIAEQVRQSGAPPDFPPTILYLTGLRGFEIATSRPSTTSISCAPVNRGDRRNREMRDLTTRVRDGTRSIRPASRLLS